MSEQTQADGTTEPQGPVVQVLGAASAEEVAVITAVFSALGGGAEEDTAPPSRWTDRARLVRGPIHPSRGGWRASALPR